MTVSDPCRSMPPVRRRGYAAARAPIRPATDSRRAHVRAMRSRVAEGTASPQERRVAHLVPALQEEDPGHQALLGGHRGVPRRSCERLELLGNGVLGHAEAGEERGEADAGSSGEPGPRAGALGKVDGSRIHCRRPATREKKPGQKLRVASMCPYTSASSWSIKSRDSAAIAARYRSHGRPTYADGSRRGRTALRRQAPGGRPAALRLDLPTTGRSTSSSSPGSTAPVACDARRDDRRALRLSVSGRAHPDAERTTCYSHANMRCA